MNKPKLIVVLGAPGSGKSTLTTKLRENMKNTTLIRESSIANSNDFKAYKYHTNIYSTLIDMKDLGSNFILDRSHICHSVYCTLGLTNTDGTFLKTSAKYLDYKLDKLGLLYDVSIVLLCASSDDYNKRLKRDKAQLINHSSNNSTIQQRAYMNYLDSMESKNINKIIFNNTGLTSDQTYALVSAQLGL